MKFFLENVFLTFYFMHIKRMPDNFIAQRGFENLYYLIADNYLLFHIPIR